jgi:hypothetical protein
MGFLSRFKPSPSNMVEYVINRSCHDTTSLFVLKSQTRRRAVISVTVRENGIPLSRASSKTMRLAREATQLPELTDPATGASPI